MYSSEIETSLGLVAGTLWIIVAMIILFAIIGIISLISIFKIFKKAGKNGWLSIVPIYNIIVLMQIIKLPYIQLLFLLIPIVGPLIFLYNYSTKLAEAFGKTKSFALGIFFLGAIFIPLLAFSDNSYVYGKQNSNEDLNSLNNNENKVINTTDNNTNINATTNNLGNENNIVEPISNPNIQPVELTPINNNQLNQDIQVIKNEQINTNDTQVIEEVPIIPTIVEPQNNETLENQESIISNAFNSVPTIPENSNIETTNNLPINEQIPEPNQEVLENLSEPIPIINNSVENLNIEPLSQNDEIENTQQKEIIQQEPSTLENKKSCKNCGAEMPNIVTICPKCGTDNE